MPWVRAPVAPLAAAFALGLGLAPWAPAAVAWALWGAALLGGASLAALDRPRAAAACLLAGVGALGVLRGAPLPLPPEHVAHLALPRLARVEGRLAGAPARAAPERTRLLLDVARVDGRPRAGRIALTVYGPAAPLAEGQRIAVEARLARASGVRNPGVPDSGAALRRAGILVTGTARADRLAALDPPVPPWYGRARHAALASVERALPPASAALLAGLLLGERAGLPRALDEAFRRAGVYHVLAVSGFNVALVAGTVFALAALAGLGPRPAALAALVAIAAFAAVAGPEPSVLRAVVMGGLVLGALLLDREAAVLNSLALAALALLAARPADLADPGFQLSFAATLGIVCAPLPRGRVAAALAVSAAAQLAVLPIGLIHFNQLATVGVLANLLAVPLAGAATVLGFLGVLAAGLHEAVGGALLAATWPVLLGLRALVALVAAVPGALLFLPAPPAPAVVAYAAALALGLGAWHRRGQPAGAWMGRAAAALAAAAVALAAWPVLRPADGRLRLTVLDVGQGDALVLETPRGRAVLIDAGPGGAWRLDAGERVVAPFLLNRGHLRVAAAVTTHDDRDHAGGLAAVRRRVAIDATLAPGRRYWIDGVSVLVLAPPAAGATGSETPEPRRNAGALVVRVDHGLAAFLLASDLPGAAERALAASAAPLAATVLKVAHHGSAGSSTPEFLARVRPAVAVISVGARNPYGHPAPATLARLAAVGAAVYRTDRDGAVLVETDGAALAVTTWATGRVTRACLAPEGGCAVW